MYGCLTLHGEGVPQSHEEAAHSLAMAVARVQFGAMLERGIGAARDPAAAARLFRPAPEQVEASGQLRRALAVQAENPVEAAKFLMRAAEPGIAQAQVTLARPLAAGADVPASAAEPAEWFALAAEQGDPDGPSSPQSPSGTATASEGTRRRPTGGPRSQTRGRTPAMSSCDAVVVTNSPGP
jgi:TPR repeat protein